MMYDVCIVGSGAGASPVAYELSNAGYRVLVLEKGKALSEKDVSKDELGVSRRDMYTPNLKDERHIINDREADGSTTRYDGAEYNWSFWNGSMLGGSSNLMSGYFHRMKPNDFKLKSVFGAIEGANVEDWCIAYEDLEPYYEKVERVVGVSGAVVPHSFLEPRSTPNFPYPKLEENKATLWFDKACESLKYNSLPTPRAILSQSALGRDSCAYSNFCGSYACATGAKGSARASLLQKCSAQVICEAFVYKLESDAEKITKVHYYDADLVSHAVQAKIFVLGAQAIESSRLLLNSKNVHFPEGMANNNAQVGKNLIFSAGGSGTGRFYKKDFSQEDFELLMQKGLFFNRSLQDWYEFDKEGKTYKGGTIDFLFEHANIISRASRELYNDEGKLIWGKALQERIFHKLTESRVLSFEVFNDWLPNDACFVSVDAKAKDKFNTPVGVINLWGHPQDVEVGEYIAKKAVHVLEAMGAKEIRYSISSAPPPNLVAGGCRFGTNPKSSVLDANCKAHELENLYVTDASFMPTGGSVPYTWTIYANAFRVADVIKKRLASS